MTTKTATQLNKKLSINELTRSLEKNNRLVLKLDLEIEPLQKSFDELLTKLGKLIRKSKTEGFDASEEIESINTDIDKFEPQIKNLIDQRKEYQSEIMEFEDQLIVHDKESEWRKLQLLLKVKSYKDVYPIVQKAFEVSHEGGNHEGA